MDRCLEIVLITIRKVEARLALMVIEVEPYAHPGQAPIPCVHTRACVQPPILAPQSPTPLTKPNHPPNPPTD